MEKLIQKFKGGAIQGFGFFFTATLFLIGFYFVKGTFTDGQVLDADSLNKIVPVGEVIWYASSSCPEGYLLTDGSIISNGNYPSLYNVLGTTFGTAGKLPDLRGEFISGFSGTRSVDTGRVFGTNQSFDDSYVSDFQYTLTDGPAANRSNTRNGRSSRFGVAITSSNTGQLRWYNSNSSGETRPRNVALLPCIKY